VPTCVIVNVPIGSVDLHCSAATIAPRMSLCRYMYSMIFNIGPMFCITEHTGFTISRVDAGIGPPVTMYLINYLINLLGS
jgi:hypothetical protein